MTDQLHNARLDYHMPFGWKAGVEYTYYHSPSSQLLHSRMGSDELDFVLKTLSVSIVGNFSSPENMIWAMGGE